MIHWTTKYVCQVLAKNVCWCVIFELRCLRFFCNPVAFQQAVKFSAVDAKNACRAGFIPVLLVENRDDVRFFKIVQAR